MAEISGLQSLVMADEKPVLIYSQHHRFCFAVTFFGLICTWKTCRI